MKRVIASALLLCAAIASSAQGTLSKAVADFCEAKALQGASVGVLAVRMGGDTLAKVNPGRRLVPASNVKMITCGAALRYLGADFRFKTTLAHSGSVSDGVLDGDIYIIGGGDPTTASKYDCAVPIDELFAEWKAMLDSAGIVSVKGTIVGDGRAWGMRKPVGDWCYEDLGFYYGATPGALNFYENAQDYTVAPGDSLGNPVSVVPFFPDAPWLILDNVARTGARGTGDALEYSASSAAPFAMMSGTYAVDRSSRIEECINHFPEYSCAYYFHNYLISNGIPVSNAFAEISPYGRIRRDPLLFDDGEKAAAREDLAVLGESLSPTLSRIAAEALRRSDNFYAETLLKAMGQKCYGSAAVDSSLMAEQKVLSGLGVSVGKEAQLRDGSGLARTNYVSPAFLVSFLRAMAGSPEYATFRKALPQPGQGTLAGRLPKIDQATRKRIFMKSGSMNGVRCYSGYILSSDGKPEKTIVFSIMINNATATQSSLCAATDALITALAAQN